MSVNGCWDALILTAGNAKQKKAFELQLEHIDLSPNVKQVHVLQDLPVGEKIGSGGATLNALHYLITLLGEDWPDSKLVLILHSGGYSQRLPHVSALGKLFMPMPDGRTMLEWKLDALTPLLKYLGTTAHGVFIAAADTLECFSNLLSDVSTLTPFIDIQDTPPRKEDLILIAHESTLEVATRHGVYALSNGDLQFVLQKPLISEMCELGAVLPSGLVYTDGSYFISAELTKKFIELRHRKGEVACELCCYADFLRPLGTRPRLEESGGSNGDSLAEWKMEIGSLMGGRIPRILNLGPDSFYHFGTNKELLDHFSPGSTFYKKFPAGRWSNTIGTRLHLETKFSSMHFYSHAGETRLCPKRCFLGWCEIAGKECPVGDDCILSGVEIAQSGFKFRSGCVYVTLCFGRSRYATAVFKLDDDLKARVRDARWFGHRVGSGNGEQSLWEARIFQLKDTAEQSLLATCEAMRVGIGTDGGDGTEERISFKRMLGEVDVELMLERRRRCIEKSSTIPPCGGVSSVDDC